VLELPLLVVGVPGNIAAIADEPLLARQFQESTRELIVGAPYVAAAERAPDEARPEPFWASPVTLGWLREAMSEGRLPTPERVDADLEARASFRLGLLQRSASTTDGNACMRLTHSVDIVLDEDTPIAFHDGLLQVVGRVGGAGRFEVVVFDPREGGSIVSARGPQRVQMQSTGVGAPPTLCV
jgi:hypothetical protein